jgi:pheromone shutdown protein TraB
MFEQPTIIENLDDMGIELIGSVHVLRRPAADVLSEISRFSPEHICVELFDPRQATTSLEIGAARKIYPDRIACIDRHIDTTVYRYLSGTPPAIYLKESLARSFFLPFNVLSIAAFNVLPGLYSRITGGKFATFGWSTYDTKTFIHERDEYMAARLLRSGGLEKKCIVLVGRRHVAGMKCILEAFRYTHDIGGYYAGGRVYEVFSLAELGKPYTLSYEKSSHNFFWNRIIGSMVRAFFLPAYVLALFAITAGVLSMAAAGIYLLIKSSI